MLSFYRLDSFYRFYILVSLFYYKLKNFMLLNNIWLNGGTYINLFLSIIKKMNYLGLFIKGFIIDLIILNQSRHMLYDKMKTHIDYDADFRVC